MSGNLMLVAVAVFVFVGARGEDLSERAHAALDGVDVIDMLRHEPAPVIDRSATLEAARRRMLELDRGDLVVVDRDGVARAVLDLRDLRGIRDRTTRCLGALMSRRSPRFVVVASDTPAYDAIERAGDASADRIVVEDRMTGVIVGLVEPADIARTVDQRSLDT